MTPEEIFETETTKEYSNEQVREMWPQARGELIGFARALSRNSNITASQLMMAIQLADEAFHNRVFKKIDIPEDRQEYPKL